jgi:hypothetical protein
MRRLLSVVAVVALLLVGCSNTERPEGIVERWLLALNQGQAGEPRRFAYLSAAETVPANWRSEDPGTFDVIEVGRAQPCSEVGPIVCEARVPFRVVLMDGEELRAEALVGIDRMGNSRAGPSRVFEVRNTEFGLILPSEGGPSIGSAGSVAWLFAITASIALIVLSEGAMALAQTRRG